jgi:ABC-type transport system substrate-binding protein
VNERIGLELKRQLQSIDVDMNVEELPQDQIIQRATKRNYDAILLEGVSGPTLFRPYLLWHSNMPFNPGGFGNPTVDAALDRVRSAPTEESYRTAVAALQDAFMEDPPAIFLAWSVQARAVSKRFEVTAPEPGRDILSTLRLWRPVTDERRVSRN